MLNFVYWPISAVLWFWHKAIGFLLEPTSGISWVLAIVLLVATIRVLLFKPMLNQQRSAIKMQQLQPAMAAIKEKYKGDQQAQAMEMRKLQQEMGINPLAGCIPVLVQMPVFLGLFHVLRSFNRTGNSGNALGLSVQENWNTPNYIFGVSEVQSFLQARVFNAPISASISMGQDQYAAFTAPGVGIDFTRTDIIAVALPLLIVSALATHFNARMSVNRTTQRQAAGLQLRQEGVMGQQMDVMNKMMLWFFPIMILVTGALWHIGLLVYMLTNNLWTFFQQRYIFKKLDKEEAADLEAKRTAKREAQEKLAPKPGAKPIRPAKGGKSQAGNAKPNHLANAVDGVGKQGPASKPAPGAQASQGAQQVRRKTNQSRKQRRKNNKKK